MSVEIKSHAEKTVVHYWRTRRRLFVYRKFPKVISNEGSLGGTDALVEDDQIMTDCY